jgi:hypothetical protein
MSKSVRNNPLIVQLLQNGGVMRGRIFLALYMTKQSGVNRRLQVASQTRYFHRQ